MSDIQLSPLSDLTEEEAEQMIGRSIVGIRGNGFRLTLKLDNGKEITVEAGDNDGLWTDIG